MVRKRKGKSNINEVFSPLTFSASVMVENGIFPLAILMIIVLETNTYRIMPFATPKISKIFYLNKGKKNYCYAKQRWHIVVFFVGNFSW